MRPPRAEAKMCARRPAARASATLVQPIEAGSSAELSLLRAKAEVCDTYRQWLITTTQKDRSRVAAALNTLRSLESQLMVPTP